MVHAAQRNLAALGSTALISSLLGTVAAIQKSRRYKVFLLTGEVLLLCGPRTPASVLAQR